MKPGDGREADSKHPLAAFQTWEATRNLGEPKTTFHEVQKSKERYVVLFAH